jgi:hypothetical protein
MAWFGWLVNSMSKEEATVLLGWQEEMEMKKDC